MDTPSLHLQRLQQLVTTALNNANDNEYLCAQDNHEEARSLLDYDSDVFEHVQLAGLTEDDVAACVATWKRGNWQAD